MPHSATLIAKVFLAPLCNTKSWECGGRVVDEECARVKQGMRILLRPGQFVNQLQWSTHHWLILLSFLVITAIEAHVGRQHALYEAYSTLLAQNFGFNYDVAMWLVVTAKLFLILFGSWIVAHVVWFIGNLLGQKNSKRVLFRRLAVVFTLILAGYTASHLENVFPWMNTASFFLFFWGGLLGYFAIREQFQLTHFETAFVGAFAVLLVLTTWNFSNTIMEKAAHKHMSELTVRPAAPSIRVKPKV